MFMARVLWAGLAAEVGTTNQTGAAPLSGDPQCLGPLHDLLPVESGCHLETRCEMTESAESPSMKRAMTGTEPDLTS